MPKFPVDAPKRRVLPNSFRIRSAYLSGAQNGGADFRLVPETAEIAVRKVILTRD
jgi:hypothetical protein